MAGGVEAQMCEKMGDDDGAEVAWGRASELLPHPDLLRRSVQASLDRRAFESAVRRLKKLLTEAPNNEKDLKALVWALVQLQDYAQAAKYLEQLVLLDPSNNEHRLGLAQCLGRSGPPAQAIVTLQPLCDREDPPYEAILIQSEFLQADGRADEATQILDRIAGDHWDEPRFLATCNVPTLRAMIVSVITRLLAWPSCDTKERCHPS